MIFKGTESKGKVADCDQLNNPITFPKRLEMLRLKPMSFLDDLYGVCICSLSNYISLLKVK